MGIGEIILTRKTLNTLRKNCPSITLTTGNQIWNNPKPNPGLCVEILASIILNQAQEFKEYRKIYLKTKSVPRSKHTSSRL